ncbi:MAG: DUF1345 domain-containing protein [Phycicoccus sp.]
MPPDRPRRDRYLHDVRRSWTAAAVAAVAGLLLLPVSLLIGGNDPLDDETSTVVVIMANWVVFGAAYIGLTLWAFGRRGRPDLELAVRDSTPARRSAGRILLEGGGATSWTVQAALVALGLLVVLSTTERFRTSGAMIGGGAVLVAACWGLMVVSYAVRYLREDVETPGLEFGGVAPPVFDDYLYQAVAVSASFATSDVTPTTTRMRRTVRSHTLIAFVFNTVILALLVSLLTAVAA